MQRADAPVHEILKAYLSEDFLDRPQGMTTDDPRWPETRSFISELLTFLWDFPRSGTWFTDSAVTADVSLDILEKALYAVEGIYRGTETVEQAWPSKLMRFISNMESWNSRDHSSNGIFTRPTPIELRDKAIAVVQLSLRMILGDYAENGDNPIWLVGKEFLDVCLNSIESKYEVSSGLRKRTDTPRRQTSPTSPWTDRFIRSTSIYFKHQVSTSLLSATPM